MLEHDQPWNLPPHSMRLQEREVHIWRVSVSHFAPFMHRLQEILSEEERARASRFRFERDHQRWIVAHAILRLLLSQYVGISTANLRFQTNAYGKPSLAFPILTPPLQFNLSHAADLVLYAFASTARVGIDVEYQRTDVDYEALARVSFSPREQMMLRTVPHESKGEAFFRCWTRKEAYIKAKGLGFSLPLDSFDVSFLTGEPVALLDSRENREEVERWRLQNLFPGRGYAGALAIEGKDWHVSCWQYYEDI